MAESPALRAHAILKQLVAVEEGARAAEAIRLCGDDPALLGRVRRLLAALTSTEGFLESPIGKSIRDAASARDQPGLPHIPGFAIERLIGVGGMAAVYEATQELPRRRVALKVLRRSMVGTAALRRFEFETEVLAKLRHPNIAQIFEAGTFDDGAGAIPFFAMEFIEGARTLTAHCAAQGLDHRARVELMVQVCDAVQHGHQNGVIHRDLKPGNVLVDSTGAPRVIDFGIARSTLDEAHGQHTTMGQIVGTLNAMSPEQCLPNAGVDARTDVYSLGVLLYELLCRRPPHDLTALPIPEALRVIHEVQPIRPSAIDPRLKGDLEAILLMAMDKDPGRRYPTVAALGADLRRHLEHQTVEARPPTVLYQLRLFARRHRTLVTAAGVVAATLVAATAVSVVSAVRAETELGQRIKAEAVAREERDRARRKSYLAGISAALLSAQSSDFAGIRRHLDSAPMEERGWEWQWLDATTDTSERAVAAHRRMIPAMAANAAGDRALTVGHDGKARIWSLPAVEPVAEIDLGRARGQSVAILDASGIGAVGTTEGQVVLLRLADGVELGRIDLGPSAVASLSAAGASTLAAVGADGDLRILDIGRPEQARNLRPSTGRVDGARFTADGSTLVTWTSDGAVQILDGERFERLRGWSVPDEIGMVDVRADLDRVAVGRVGGVVSLHSLASGEEVMSLGMRDQLSLVRSIAFNGDGSIIAVGQGSSHITLIDLPSTTLRSVATGHREAVSGLAFIDDGRHLLSASWDGSMRVFSAGPRGEGLFDRFAAHQGRVLGVDVARAGDIDRVIVASADGTASIWPLAERGARPVDGSVGALLTLRGHDGLLFDAAFSPDGTLAATAGSDGTVRLWSTDTGAEVARMDHAGGAVWSVSFRPDGKAIASGGDDGAVRLWAVPSGQPLAEFEGHDERVTSVSFSHDGRRIASTSRDESARIWSADGSAPPLVLRGHEWDVFDAVWSRDDRELYTGSRDQTVRIWSAESGAAIAVLDDPRQFVTSLALSPDGSRLVAGLWFGGLCLIDPTRREFIASFRAASSTIRGVAFSPDGRRLVFGSGDGSINVLDGESAPEPPAAVDR